MTDQKPTIDFFEQAAQLVLRIEGGWADHPHDNGKTTRFGISSRAHPDVDLVRLTPKGAKAIYKRDYWKPAKCGQMPPGIGLLLFDAAVHSGVRRAVTILQNSLKVTPDGIIGPVTMAAIEAANKLNLIDEFQAQRSFFLGLLPDHMHFGLGWQRRLVKVAEHARTLYQTHRKDF